MSAAAIRSIPVALDSYLAAIDAKVLVDEDLLAGESGYSLVVNGKIQIGVNAKELPERQRFTICHEIAHVVLRLPSDHSQIVDGKRPQAEVLCDAFAAELLLPFDLFQPLAEDAAVTLDSIEALASQFQASMTCTGSCFASAITTPCAFVLSHKGKVRHAARSKSLEEAYAQIPFGFGIPRNSVSAKVRSGAASTPAEIDADEWFNCWERGGRLIEDARHFSDWDQTITLLKFVDDQIPPPRPVRSQRWSEDLPQTPVQDDELLEELDGHLRWPRSKRK